MIFVALQKLGAVVEWLRLSRRKQTEQEGEVCHPETHETETDPMKSRKEARAVQKATMLIDVDWDAEREENDPKQPMNYNPVFFAASQFGVWISTLELELAPFARFDCWAKSSCQKSTI